MAVVQEYTLRTGKLEVFPKLIILSSVLLSDGGPFCMSAEEQNNSLEKKNLEFMQFLKLTIAQHTEKL